MPAATTDRTASRPSLTIAPHAVQPPLPLEGVPPAPAAPIYSARAHSSAGDVGAVLTIRRTDDGYLASVGLSYDPTAARPEPHAIGRALTFPTYAAALAALMFGRLVLEGTAEAYARDIGARAPWITTVQRRLSPFGRAAGARARAGRALVDFQSRAERAAL